jgi:hypothetical protein
MEVAMSRIDGLPLAGMWAGSAVALLLLCGPAAARNLQIDCAVNPANPDCINMTGPRPKPDRPAVAAPVPPVIPETPRSGEKPVPPGGQGGR